LSKPAQKEGWVKELESHGGTRNLLLQERQPTKLSIKHTDPRRMWIGMIIRARNALSNDSYVAASATHGEASVHVLKAYTNQQG
jgi:hypothetical protein